MKRKDRNLQNILIICIDDAQTDTKVTSFVRFINTGEYNYTFIKCEEYKTHDLVFRLSMLMVLGIP